MFKPKQIVDWFCMEDKTNIAPKTTTQEMLELGQAKKKKKRSVRKKILNLRTYPMNDFRFDCLKSLPPKERFQTTTYERDYTAKDIGIHLPYKMKELLPDKFWNRRPLSDFAIERITSSEYKFMDDHLINVTEQRKRVNFLRQIRNQHRPLA